MRRTTLKFDELNSLSRSEYEEYFDEMGIDEDAKQDRVLMAMAFEDKLLPILAFIQDRITRKEQFLERSESMFEQAFMAVALTRMDLSEEDLRYTAQLFAGQVALSTYRNMDDPYFTSIDRAINISATESNAVNCFGERVDAKNMGMTLKTWNTIIDGHEREWHEEVDGLTVPIDEPFEVNGDLLMQPLDTSLGAGADNIANCRCWATYE